MSSDLSDNKITSIPQSLGQLSNLTDLHLDSNEITSIPEAIGQLGNLTSLGLSGNQITAIPDVIGKLSKLGWFSIGHNKITFVPKTLRNLENLKTLDLGENPLPLPPEILQNLKSYKPRELLTLLDSYFLTRNSLEEAAEALHTVPQPEVTDKAIEPTESVTAQNSQLKKDIAALYAINARLAKAAEPDGYAPAKVTRAALKAQTSLIAAIKALEKMDDIVASDS